MTYSRVFQTVQFKRMATRPYITVATAGFGRAARAKIGNIGSYDYSVTSNRPSLSAYQVPFPDISPFDLKDVGRIV